MTERASPHEPVPGKSVPRVEHQRLRLLLQELRSRVKHTTERSETTGKAETQAIDPRIEAALRDLHEEVVALRGLVNRVPEAVPEPDTPSPLPDRDAIATSTTGERQATKESAQTTLWTVLILLLAVVICFTCGVLVHSALYQSLPTTTTPVAAAASQGEPTSQVVATSSPPAQVSEPNQSPPTKELETVLRDSDGDGLFDPDQDGVSEELTDQCPLKPGPVVSRGCPPRDTDNDGKLDPDDACPEVAETTNGYRDEDGCPDELPENVRSFTGTISGINFDNNRATLRPGATEILDRAAKVFASYPELRVEISGHTDSTGSRRHNLELSRARAETVRRYLISRGVDGTRLETVGYGPDRPISDNRGDGGRLRNRRIEFKILDDQHPPAARP